MAAKSDAEVIQAAFDELRASLGQRPEDRLMSKAQGEAFAAQDRASALRWLVNRLRRDKPRL